MVSLPPGLRMISNNVLSAITGSAALIDADLAKGPTPFRGHVERILQAGVQAQGLIKRLLNFGARRSTRTQTDLGGAVGEAVDLLRSGIPQRIDLTLKSPNEPIVASADATDLIQIILNLGINARDAMGERTGEISIELSMMDDPPPITSVGSVDPARSYAVISVSDTGAGMTADQIASIFKAYFSTKGDKGTGLGLSVVSTIVRGLGGAIVVNSVSGQRNSI